MRILILLVAILSFAGCSSTSRKDKERASLHLQIGTGYLAQGMYPQAIAELMRAEQLDPTNPAAQNNLGLAYYVRGRLSQAEQKFRQAVKIKSDYSDAKNNLARVLIDQEKYEESIKLLQQIEGDLTYHYPEKTMSNLGMAHFMMGNYKKAEDYLARSLQIRRDSCTTANYYGRALQELKRTRESAQILDNAVEYCRPTKFEEPLFFSAMSYFSLGDKEKSRARIEELLKDYPKSKYVAKAKGLLGLLEQ